LQDFQAKLAIAGGLPRVLAQDERVVGLLFGPAKEAFGEV